MEKEVLEDELPESEDSYEQWSIVVDKGQEPLRIDKFLMKRVDGATRNKIQQSIENELVLVNDKPIKSNYKIKFGDKITIFDTRQPDANKIIPQDIPLKIIYEDDDLMVIEKSVGMVVHPGCGNPDGTLLNAFAGHLKKSNPEINEEDLPRFGMVHRIDKNTSGLLVLAKTQHAMSHLAKQFANHIVHRRYKALVWGDMENNEGTIIAHVGRHQRYRKLFTAYPEGDYGKEAITHYTVLERFNYVTLVECRLETGRTHQIRVHMQYIGHPLFNDDLYGGDKIVKGTVYQKYKQFVDNCFELCPRHALHAGELGFIHPRTEEFIKFESPLPADIHQLIEKWRHYVANRFAGNQ